MAGISAHAAEHRHHRHNDYSIRKRKTASRLEQLGPVGNDATIRDGSEIGSSVFGDSRPDTCLIGLKKLFEEKVRRSDATVSMLIIYESVSYQTLKSGYLTKSARYQT